MEPLSLSDSRLIYIDTAIDTGLRKVPGLSVVFLKDVVIPF